MALSYWGTVGSLFKSGGATITGDHFDRSSSTNGGDLVWVDTYTPSAGYSVGSNLTYTLVIGENDRYGDVQDAITITSFAMTFPFVSTTGNSTAVAAAASFTNSNGSSSGMALWWQPGATAGTWDIKFDTYTDNVFNSPALTLGGIGNLISGISGTPISWAMSWNSNASALVLGYSLQAAAGTQNIYVDTFNQTGGSTAPGGTPQLVASGVSTNVAWDVMSTSNWLWYLQENNAGSFANVDVYKVSNTTTGLALGATSFSMVTPLNDLVSMGAAFVTTSEVFGVAEGTTTGSTTDKLAVGFFNDTSGGTLTGFGGTTITMSSSSQVHYQFTGTSATSTEALAWSDANHVYLDLFDWATGNQLGSTIDVTATYNASMTTFDRIRSLGDGRFELDFRTGVGTASASDPQAIIFDSRTAGVTLSGNGVNAELVGTPFADTFTASAGADWINGGLGTDTADYSTWSSGITVVVAGASGTVGKGAFLDKLSSIEVIKGTAFNDVFYVDSAESVAGGGGFNVLIELSASVTVSIGDSNHTSIQEFIANAGTNNISVNAADTDFVYVYGGGAGSTNTLTLGSGGGYLFSNGGTNHMFGGTNASATDVFIGGVGTSDMHGGTGANVYYTGASDTVAGAGVFNTDVLLATGVTLTYGSNITGVQQVQLNGGTNTVTMTGSGTLSYIYGGAGTNTMTLGAAGGYELSTGGTNHMFGQASGSGTDVFVGNVGTSDMHGGTGNNVYYVGLGDSVFGSTASGAYNTIVELGSGASLTLGSATVQNVQQFIFNAGNNTLNASSATGQIIAYGAAGNDSLTGGTGNDYFWGGAGTNTFVEKASWGQDTIVDWTTGTSNHIDLTALSASGIHSTADITQTVSSGNLVITSTHTGANSITLLGVGAALGSSSFVFA